MHCERRRCASHPARQQRRGRRVTPLTGDAVRRALRRALAPKTIVPLLVAGLAAFGFVELADEVREGHATPVDERISLWLHGYDSPLLDVVMRALTVAGSYAATISVALVAVSWSAAHRRPRVAGVLVTVTVAASLLNASLKLFFARERPGLFFEIALPATYSFPSGHAMVSTAVYGMVAILLARLRPRLRWPIYLATAALVFSIGVSRVYLGVHWPSDVAAGFAAGALIVIAGRFALKRD